MTGSILACPVCVTCGLWLEIFRISVSEQTKVIGILCLFNVFHIIFQICTLDYFLIEVSLRAWIYA